MIFNSSSVRLMRVFQLLAERESFAVDSFWTDTRHVTCEYSTRH